METSHMFIKKVSYSLFHDYDFGHKIALIKFLTILYRCDSPEYLHTLVTSISLFT